MVIVSTRQATAATARLLDFAWPSLAEPTLTTPDRTTTGSGAGAGAAPATATPKMPGLKSWLERTPASKPGEWQRSHP